jgi:hypothetical protein
VLSSFNVWCRGQDAASEARYCRSTNVVANALKSDRLEMRHEKLDINDNQFAELIKSFSVYKTDLYEVQTSRAGEIRFGPEYKFIKVYSKGVEIWDGGQNIYGEESFQHNVLGEAYDKLILIKWFSESNPYEQAVVEINLATGKETKLDINQRYWEAGHFNSFDGMFYKKSDIKDYLCKDFAAKSDFLLYERINEKIKNAFSWTVTSIKDCILVYSRQTTDNVLLFNIRKKEIIDFHTIDFEVSERGTLNISSHLDKRNSELTIRYHDHEWGNDNKIANSNTKYFKISLNK